MRGWGVGGWRWYGISIQSRMSLVLCKSVVRNTRHLRWGRRWYRTPMGTAGHGHGHGYGQNEMYE